jgi:hypothetical protein
VRWLAAVRRVPGPGNGPEGLHHLLTAGSPAPTSTREEVRTMEIKVMKVERIEATLKHDYPTQAA